MRDKCMIVAEMSANHNGKKETAIETVRAAKRAGADAVKLQTYRADTITLRCDKPDFIINEGSIWDGQYFYDLYEQAYTPWEWHEELFHVAKEEGLICFSSPFDKTAVDMLEALDCPVYKIASFEITDIPLIEYAASKHKPMVLATGIATEEDIQLAVEACRRMGNNDITVLKCTSMEEKDFAQMVKDVRMAELSLGKTTYELTEKMRGSRSASRSLYVAEDMKAGEVITERNVRSVRPGFGLHPKYLKDILGKNVNRDLEKGTRFALEYVNG